MSDTKEQKPQPFAAPCRQLPFLAALPWLRAGWRDYRRSFRVSVSYGLLIFLISISISALSWWLGSYVLVLSMLSGFIFVAPLLATGLYSVSRQVNRGETPSVSRSLKRMRTALSDAMVFAGFTFSASAFSLPMIVDRDCDMITASVTSINAVLRNKPAMLFWILCIVALTAIGFATLGLGLIITVPLLGYATYHGYLETIDASQWPDSPE